VLTILCSPKPFIGTNAWNQRNALRSWRAIHPDVEIILFGAPEGAVEAAAEVSATVVSEFETSPSGAPSFNAMVAYADAHCQHDLIVYANCDILLNGTLLRAMQAARQRFDRFLLVGERLDLAEDVSVDVRQSNWTEGLHDLVVAGKLMAHGPTGADYFGFVRNSWRGLPTVYMGRGICDQALLHHCLRSHVPIIDGTLAVVNVHQFHGYQHVAGGVQQAFYGDDSKEMARLHGLRRGLPTIADANWRLVADNTIQPDRVRRRALRRMELSIRYDGDFEPLAVALRALQYWRGRRGLAARKFSLDEILAAWRLTQAALAGTTQQP
jgi:hypothetical protein